jgi:hypothetical protein
MAYVEVHTLENSYQIVLVGVDTGDEPNDVVVTTAEFIEPMIGQLGVTLRGPWEPIMGDGTHDVQRAVIVTSRW